jgi:hypothetical protein
MSLGGGVQTILEGVLHAIGELPPIDAAVFADTTEEPRRVYAQLQWLEEFVARSPHPYPIHRVTKGPLWESAVRVRTTRDGERRYIETSIPVHFKDADGEEGRGLRTCSIDFKIELVTATTRMLLGRFRRQIKEEEGVLAQMLIGFTIDEIYRVKPNPNTWLENVFPLVDAGMSRADCYAAAERLGLPALVGSACKQCPNRTDWGSLDPDEFQQSIERERELQAAYKEAGIRSVPYLHHTRVPLSEIKLSSSRRRKMAEEQLNLFINQCEGGCGT